MGSKENQDPTQAQEPVAISGRLQKRGMKDSLEAHAMPAKVAGRLEVIPLEFVILQVIPPSRIWRRCRVGDGTTAIIARPSKRTDLLRRSGSRPWAKIDM